MIHDTNKSKKSNKNQNINNNKEYNNNNKITHQEPSTNEEVMTIAEYRNKFGGKAPPQYKGGENKHTHIVMKRQPVKIDNSLGVKKCEYCSNFVDNLPKHYLECNAKKIIENENKKYKMNMKNMTSNDEAMAKILQKKFGGMRTGGDYALAQKLQKEFMPNTKNDEMMARKLQSQFAPNTRNDEKDNDQFLPPCDSCDHHVTRYVYPDGGSTK
jgi:hypothetical protein